MKKFICSISTLFLFISFFSIQGCKQDDLKKTDFNTEYQVVLLAGGLGYFGKIEKIGQHYIEIKDVYYIQNMQNPETNQIDNILVKRGKEFHGPDRTYINTAHVLMIESVAPDSKLAQSIKALKAKGDK